MATVTPSIGGGGGGGGSGGGGGEDRVLATAQQIVKSLNTPKEVREDMLLIFSSFDNRLSNITDLIDGEDSKAEIRFDAAEKVIYRWESNSETSRNSIPWEESPDDAAEYLAAVDEILQLIDGLSIVTANNEFMDRAESAIQIAMARLEDEFRLILTRNTIPFDPEQLEGLMIRKRTSMSSDGDRRSLSMVSNDGETEADIKNSNSLDGKSYGEGYGESFCSHERGLSVSHDFFVDLIHPDAVAELREIADRMIRSGYEKECCQVYSNVRRDALDECLVILGVEKLSIDEVQKIEWKILDEKMKKWIQAVKIVVRVLLAGEKQLCDQIFEASDLTKELCFNESAKGCLLQLLNFGEAVSIGQRSSEKLFRILDMYDVMVDSLPDLEMMVTDEFVIREARGVLDGLGDAAKGTFAEFEKAVQSEASRKPMLGGEIHPLTRYVLNYVKLLVDYSETLNSLLERDEDELKSSQSDDVGDNVSPIAQRLLLLLSCLEKNLDEKSKLYEDSGMQHIFLMNNIFYIVQKVKGSELGKLLGDDWLRKRRGQVRQLATAYLRASWTRVLSCLKDEGLSGSSSNASKVALKDRFKCFNAYFEELHRTQSLWKVPDPQLREELRISISEKLIPAYRSFMGRFGNQLESGRHAGRYIKYTAEDLENYLLDFFEGSSSAFNLRRKG